MRVVPTRISDNPRYRLPLRPAILPFVWKVRQRYHLSGQDLSAQRGEMLRVTGQLSEDANIQTLANPI